jgi:general secretion pathway protein I
MMSLSGLKNRSECPGNRGFTLIEMMVAVSVIAIVLLAVYRLHSQTLLMNFSARFYTVAPLLAQNKLADIEMDTVKELAEGSGDFGEDYAGYSWDVKISDVESEQLKTTAERLKRVDIKVLFNQGELSYNLRTYRLFE